MTKEELHKKVEAAFGTGLEVQCVMALIGAMHAIIDALPDEPEYHWRRPDGTTGPYKIGQIAPWDATVHEGKPPLVAYHCVKPDCLGGPEPVAERASEPTSAQEHRCTNPGHRAIFGTSTPGICPTCGLPIRDDFLGQRSDPPATSAEAQEPQREGLIINNDDARKLRIIKAMETWKGRAFKFTDGCWWIRNAGGDISWENWKPFDTADLGRDPEERLIDKQIEGVRQQARAKIREEELKIRFPDAAPGEAKSEPLWEGETWVHPARGAVPCLPGQDEKQLAFDGWRKIKVREVRE